MAWLSPEEHTFIEESVALLCVEILIVDSLEHPSKVLLVKRAEEPALGQWFQPGGMIRKNEPARVAALRKAKEELGVEVTLGPFIGAYRSFFMPGHRNNPSGTDACSLAFVGVVSSSASPHVDATSSAWAWKHYSDPEIASFPKRLMMSSGLFPSVTPSSPAQMAHEGLLLLEKII